MPAKRNTRRYSAPGGSARPATYAADEDGDLVVFEASKEKKVLSTTNLGAPIYSTPVVANGVLYVSSNTHLFAFQNTAKPMANLQPAP